MQYPMLLEPKSKQEFLLPSGKKMLIAKATPVFPKWMGSPIEDTYGGKPVLNFNGEPVFAELAILRIFQADAWDGVWIDTFKHKYRTQYWPDTNEIALPGTQQEILRRLAERIGTMEGCWDVFCWKGDNVIFVESKRKSRDSIRQTQVRWLE